MEIKIEKDVPIEGTKKPIHTKYPFKKMEVGDSFKVSVGENQTPNQLRNNLFSNIRYFIKMEKPTWRFTSRVVSETEVRIWRTA